MIIADFYEDGTDITMTVFGSGTVTITSAESCAAEAVCRDVKQVDELKPNMNFYQTKMHRRKKGGKVSFR